MSPLFDAHCHYQDARLDSVRGAFLRELRDRGCRAVVNGTQESDWADVASLAQAEAWVIPAFGLHPWHVGARSGGWCERLEAVLEANPSAGIGEVGLDRWIEGHDLADQMLVLREELALARQLGRVVTIHCLKAWGALEALVRERTLPESGFLIHAYGGSLETAQVLADHGAYFSFSPSFLQPRKSAQREVFARLPRERLLVETDAPDLGPPPERNAYPLTDPSGQPVNDPRNLEVASAGLAEVRQIPVDELQSLLAENFTRLFGSQVG